ncbi:MAG: ThuA domain-containing protein [bacterium]|nr:ThuA domain-containing protein [bacterium]
MMSKLALWAIAVCLSPSVWTGGAARAEGESGLARKIVFIAGKKSHGPGAHEYEMDANLVKFCLDHAANLKGLRTEVHFDGWPLDPATLDDADTIVVDSDGSNFGVENNPLLRGDHMTVLQKQMQRGCGLVILHYTTFVPSEGTGEQFLEWVGGYFDYEKGDAPNHWYSKITNAKAEVTPASPAHPVCRGLKPFTLAEEFYHHMRFRDPDPRRTPVLTVKLPGETQDQTVAWAVQRADGGRGFVYTGGHSHDNWKLENYRRMILNGIAWSAHGEVPESGVESPLPPPFPRPEAKAGRPVKAVIVSGLNTPPIGSGAIHPETKEGVMRALREDPLFEVEMVTDPEFLASPKLFEYDLVLPDECYWSKAGLSEAAKAGLVRFVSEGGGLAIIHFADGAFTASPKPLPAENDWPQYREMCRRVWIEGKSRHDAYGPFHVDITPLKHPITDGMKGFDTVDELYFDQQGPQPIVPLATARAKGSGKDEPLAFAYSYGKGRVFQDLLGHNAQSFDSPGVRELVRRGCAWAAGRSPQAK